MCVYGMSMAQSNGYVVYKHISPSGKAYIGQTNNLSRRSIRHQSSGSGCSAFYSAIKKYGWSNFKHEVLVDDLTLPEANDWERFYVFIENTLSPNGYNLKTGGDKGTHSEETKLKMSMSAKGRLHSIETREKISAINRSQSEETKYKRAASLRGQKRSPETKEKMSLARKNISAETREKLSLAAKLNWEKRKQ